MSAISTFKNAQGEETHPGPMLMILGMPSAVPTTQGLPVELVP